MLIAVPYRRSLHAMSCEVELVTYAPNAERRLRWAQKWLRSFEARFSRFQNSSELSALNASAGRPFHASRALFRLLQQALLFAERTNGVFDPTVLPYLQAAGYGSSFDSIETIHHASDKRIPEVTWKDVSLNPEDRSIVLPRGAGIDLGGIGKGWAVDQLARILGSPCLVNIGGDLFTAGTPHDANQWLVGIEDPFNPGRDVAVLPVTNSGVATSSSLRRRWSSSDGINHHLIDSRTGRPSLSDAVQVTVIASTAVEADVHAKVALLLGMEMGPKYLTEQGVVGLMFGRDGSRYSTVNDCH